MKKHHCQLLVTSLFIITLIIIGSCNKNTGSGNCEDASTIENSAGLELHIKDTTINRFIYDKTQPLYSIDSIQIWNNQGTRYKPFLLDAVDTTDFRRAYYSIGIYGLYDSRYDVNMYSDTVRKNIYIRYKVNEWDTLSISYKARSGQCGSQFAFLKVEYHNKIISYTQNEFVPHFLIKK